MSYREPAGQVLEALTARGVLRVELGPRRVTLAVGARSLELADRAVTLVEHLRRADRRTHYAAGRLAIARDLSRGDVGVWIEVDTGTARAGMRRIFAIDPVNLLDPRGLAALRTLEPVARGLRSALGTARATEVGSPAAGGLDKVLVLDTEDRLEVYARRLFRDRARLVIAAHADGRIAIRGKRDLVVRSRFGVTVVGDYLRFAAPDGLDLGRVAIPWLTPEDRGELARRIGMRVDH